VNPLQRRLSALRRRLRLVAAARGVSWLATVLLALVCLSGLLDWAVHLPSLLRAVLLVCGLTGAGCIGYRHLLAPLAAPLDDLSLALQLEKRYPVFNDALASAVQFLKSPDVEGDPISPSLRRAAVDRALGQAQGLNFNALVDKRGLLTGPLSCLVAGGLALALGLSHPQLARIGLLRLMYPFSDHAWPTQTQLEIVFRDRAARGEPYVISGIVRGVIPERVVLEARFPGVSPTIQSYEPAGMSEAAEGHFQARLDPGPGQEQFRFQVRAHDAVTPWYEVRLLAPPQLVLLDGRPSPQFHLEFPSYTELAPRDLPDLVSLVEVIAGTHITLRAATDRPIARAWLEVPAELHPVYQSAACLPAAVVSPNRLDCLTPGLLSTLSPAPWQRIPARLEPEGCEFGVEFLARVSGTFALHFEDELGIGNSRLIELRTLRDPPAAVHLDRPSRTQDVLEVLPDAEVTLHVQVEDPIFAVRSANLGFRTQRDGTGPGSRLPLYEHAVWEQALPALLAGLQAGPLPAPLSLVHLRPPRVTISRRWSLADLHLREGDVLTLQAAADDFDDVTVLKPPGRSQEVELRIINRTSLDILLNQAQATIQQGLVRLHKLQREALDKVTPAEGQWRRQGKLAPKQLDELLQAEQLQQQIRGRVGDAREGLRADVARVLQSLKDNHLPSSGTQDRMRALAAELDRLKREDLEQIEPRLTEARKESELGSKRSAEARAAGPLADAHRRQQDAERTLREMLQLLEPWSSTQEAEGEARSILQEQQKLRDQLARFADRVGGQKPEDWPEDRRTEKEQLAGQQNQLAERAGQLLDRLERLAEERRGKDPQKAQALAEAARRGQESNVAGQMQEAEQLLQKNQLHEAGKQQQQAARGMEQVVNALRERREDELDRLIKKLRQAEEELADLSERQDRLQKKVQEAEQIADARQRAETLKRLAREQEQLQEQTQELVRELSRLRAEGAAQALGEAGGRMQQASRQLSQGADAGEQQEEALDRLDDAQRGLQQEREQAEEELAREKVGRITDQIRALRARQEALIAEAQRLHRAVLQAGQWSREYEDSLVRLQDDQKGLGEETEQAAKEKMEGAKVFEHLLSKSAEAMQRASERMEERKQAVLGRKASTAEGQAARLDPRAEDEAQGETLELQNLALRRIDQLLEALKPERGSPQRAGRPSQGGGAGGGGAGGQGGGSDSIPPLAQLKALRALQQELFERTRDFNQHHPEPAKLGRRQQMELQALHQEQEEIASLFQEISAPQEHDR
jgi:hypothetical protein